MKALKYLLVFILPISVYISFTSKGWLTFLPVFLFFGCLPLLELFIKPDTQNLNKEEEKKAKENPIYTYILYTMIPLQLLFLGLFFNAIKNEELTILELIGRITSMGLMCGVIGLNVGHELGHRQDRFSKLLGEILLFTSLNPHFLPYHNGGHHFNVATPNDAATARKNEWLYAFWIRSHFTSYLQAWELENKRMKEEGNTWFHPQNKMVLYSFILLVLLLCIYYFFGLKAFILFICAAVFGILLLETVNYIEHYGLLRKKNEKGRYQRVNRTHSWNSNHAIGKLLLFNLSRHSDHHYNGSKPYQLLKTLPESPQMPTGYPGMMLLALFPPLWFWLMHKKLDKIYKS